MGYDPYRPEARRMAFGLLAVAGVGVALVLRAILRPHLGSAVAFLAALGILVAVELLLFLALRRRHRRRR